MNKYKKQILLIWVLTILISVAIAGAAQAIVEHELKRHLPPPDGQATYSYNPFQEIGKVVVPAPSDPYDRVLSFNETVPNVNVGGPQSFLRYDERGVICRYGNTWAGDPYDGQYVFLEYCLDDPNIR